MQRSTSGIGLLCRSRSRSDTKMLGGTRWSNDFMYASPCWSSFSHVAENAHPVGPVTSRVTRWMDESMPRRPARRAFHSTYSSRVRWRKPLAIGPHPRLRHARMGRRHQVD